MAAFPPPALRLNIDSPLSWLIRECPGLYTAHGPECVNPDATHILRWMRSLPLTPLDLVLGQFEQLLQAIYRHRGPIDGRDTFGETWPTPHDCLAYFADWRREVAVAVSHVPGFFDPRWRTEAVTMLAKGIDADRAFDRLPILADALEEAGGDHPLVLTHLRENADHAHHCWVVDLLSFGGRPLET